MSDDRIPSETVILDESERFINPGPNLVIELHYTPTGRPYVSIRRPNGSSLMTLGLNSGHKLAVALYGMVENREDLAKDSLLDLKDTHIEPGDLVSWGENIGQYEGHYLVWGTEKTARYRSKVGHFTITASAGSKLVQVPVSEVVLIQKFFRPREWF